MTLPAAARIVGEPDGAHGPPAPVGRDVSTRQRGALALTPGGVAAPAGRRILAQARFDALTLLRNGEQVFVSLVLPALVLVAAVRVPLASSWYATATTRHALLTGSPPITRIDLVTPGIMGLAVVSTAFTGQAIALGFDRRYGVLRLLGTTPLARSGLLAGRLLAVAAVEVLQVAVLSALALALGWHPLRQGALGLLILALVLALGTLAFGSLALLLAGTMRAEAVLAVANLAYVLLAAAGLVLPLREPSPLVTGFVSVLPSGALGDAARAASLDGQVAVVPVLVLLGWGVLAAFAVFRTFRWSEA